MDDKLLMYRNSVIDVSDVKFNCTSAYVQIGCTVWMQSYECICANWVYSLDAVYACLCVLFW